VLAWCGYSHTMPHAGPSLIPGSVRERWRTWLHSFNRWSWFLVLRSLFKQNHSSMLILICMEHVSLCDSHLCEYVCYHNPPTTIECVPSSMCLPDDFHWWFDFDHGFYDQELGKSCIGLHLARRYFLCYHWVGSEFGNQFQVAMAPTVMILRWVFAYIVVCVRWFIGNIRECGTYCNHLVTHFHIFPMNHRTIVTWFAIHFGTWFRFG
jgi:hypothetical protein